MTQGLTLTSDVVRPWAGLLPPYAIWDKIQIMLFKKLKTDECSKTDFSQNVLFTADFLSSGTEIL